jgi:hypothetical protein
LEATNHCHSHGRRQQSVCELPGHVSILLSH